MRAVGPGVREAAGAALAGIAGLGVCALGLGLPGPAAVAVGHSAGGPQTRAGGAAPIIFRVDVSQYPQIGLVVTVPGTPRALPGRDFSVTVDNRTSHPSVHRLSRQDLELVLAPDADLGSAALRVEQAAAARFMTWLPTGAHTLAVDPATPGVLPGTLSGDPAPSVTEIASLTRATPSVAGASLATALSAFTAGPHVRRTVVLVVSRNQPLTRAAVAGFSQRLAASGTALYVLDVAPGGAPDYDALAAGSGGFARRIRVPADWSSLFSAITRSLSEQYYLRFTDIGRLPGRVTVAIITRTRTLRRTVDLPVSNPIAPPLTPAPQPSASGPADNWDTPLIVLAALLIVLGVAYGMGMLVASRRDPRPDVHRKSLSGLGQAITGHSLPRARDDLFFVFMMPCLNEEKVILNSLQRLLSISGDDFVVLVIDDGSDDNTVDLVSGILGERVWLLSRKLPEARQGKGEALNAAVRYLIGGGHLADRDLDSVIVVVVDADGRLDPQSIEQVRPYFADPTIGAVQIGVRINNREQSRLARMQDMEFVIYTEVFQRGRRHLGSVGLGGNGQFMRLSAMMSLGPSPWTRSLTDDLDLGVRLIAAGWRNEYCPTVAVHQQGVVGLRRLIRQRSRWFQGHLQSWKLIPLVLRSAPRRSRADLIYHLSSPAVLLIASLLSASFLLSLANSAALTAEGQNPFGWWVASTYALTVGPAFAFSFVYWLRERSHGVGLLRTVMFAHMYVCYGMMWYASGWWAVVRTLRGRTGWAKTDRVAEPQVPKQTRLAIPGELRPTVSAMAVRNDATASGSTGPGAVRSGVSEPPPMPALGRPKQHRTVAAAAAVVLACAVSGAVVADSGTAGHRPAAPWQSVFTGYGTTSVTGSITQLAVTLQPARTRSRNVTHAALVVSASPYGDFVATLRVRTLQQLRHGVGGSPNPWEVGWVVWHYTSNQHFYALTLEPTGWELSQENPAYPGGERFLASGRTPVFRVGVTHTVGIVQIGNRMTVSADGRVLVRFADTQQPYMTGAVGFYSEDAQARFDHIRLFQLPALPQAPAQITTVRRA